MSSTSGRTTISSTSIYMKPTSSERLKRRELMIMSRAFLFLFADLEGEQTLRPHHQDGDDSEERDDLGHRPRQEELQRRLRLRDREGGGDGAEERGGAAEHDDQEGVDDVELARGRPGRTDHGEGASCDAGDTAAEPQGVAV